MTRVKRSISARRFCCRAPGTAQAASISNSGERMVAQAVESVCLTPVAHRAQIDAVPVSALTCAALAATSSSALASRAPDRTTPSVAVHLTKHFAGHPTSPAFCVPVRAAVGHDILGLTKLPPSPASVWPHRSRPGVRRSTSPETATLSLPVCGLVAGHAAAKRCLCSSLFPPGLTGEQTDLPISVRARLLRPCSPVHGSGAGWHHRSISKHWQTRFSCQDAWAPLQPRMLAGLATPRRPWVWPELNGQLTSFAGRGSSGHSPVVLLNLGWTGPRAGITPW